MATMPASVDRGPQMLAIWWAMDGVALLFVLLRMYARVVVRRAAGLDDFIIVLASVRRPRDCPAHCMSLIN